MLINLSDLDTLLAVLFSASALPELSWRRLFCLAFYWVCVIGVHLAKPMHAPTLSDALHSSRCTPKRTLELAKPSSPATTGRRNGALSRTAALTWPTVGH